jgi:hypothetical protein
MCITPGLPFNVPSTCQPIAGAKGLKVLSSPVLDAGSCAPAGGQPTGAATPTSSTTFCCAP